jgi:hypothetical protein
MKHQDPNEKEGTEETVAPPAEETTQEQSTEQGSELTEEKPAE